MGFVVTELDVPLEDKSNAGLLEVSLRHPHPLITRAPDFPASLLHRLEAMDLVQQGNFNFISLLCKVEGGVERIANLHNVWMLLRDDGLTSASRSSGPDLLCGFMLQQTTIAIMFLPPFFLRLGIPKSLSNWSGLYDTLKSPRVVGTQTLSNSGSLSLSKEDSLEEIRRHESREEMISARSKRSLRGRYSQGRMMSSDVAVRRSSSANRVDSTSSKPVMNTQSVGASPRDSMRLQLVGMPGAFLSCGPSASLSPRTPRAPLTARGGALAINVINVYRDTFLDSPTPGTYTSEMRTVQIPEQSAVQVPAICPVRKDSRHYDKLDQYTDGFWLWNVHGGRKYFSPRLLKDVLGYTRQSGKSFNWSDLLYHEDMDLLTCLAQPKSVLDRENKMQVLLRYIAADNAVHCMLCKLEVVTRSADKKEMTQIIGINTDFSTVMSIMETTAIQTSMEEIDELRGALASKVDVIAQMSHEVRTPLHSILSLAEYVGNSLREQAGGAGCLSEEIEMLGLIRSCGEGLQVVLDDTLSYIKNDMLVAKISTVYKVLPLVVLQEVIMLQNMVAQKKGNKLIMDGEGLLTKEVYTDPHRLKQILNNLISNAIKFTRDGVITITCEEVEEDNSLIRFLVTDTGTGIGQNDLEKVFEPYMQAMNGNHGQGGTGLGLPICKQLVTALGGSIGVRSVLGKGTTFFFTIKKVIIIDSLPMPSDLKTDSSSGIDEGAHACRINLQPSSLGQCDVEELAKLRSSTKKPLSETSFNSKSSGEPLSFTSSSSSLPSSERSPEGPSLQSSSLPLLKLPSASGRMTPQLADSLKVTHSSPLQYRLNGSPPERCSPVGGQSPSVRCRSPSHPSSRLANVPSDIDLSSMRVLVVDDNRLNRKVMEASLKKLGVQVWCAGHGEEAIRLLAKAATLRERRAMGFTRVPSVEDFDAPRRIDSHPSEVFLLHNINFRSNIISESAVAKKPFLILDSLGVDASHRNLPMLPLQDPSYHIVLMDKRMPVMNGADTARFIRHYRLIDPRKTRLVAMTADVIPDSAALADILMDDYLPKPCNLITIRNMLLSHVDLIHPSV